MSLKKVYIASADLEGARMKLVEYIEREHKHCRIRSCPECAMVDDIHACEGRLMSIALDSPRETTH